MRTRGYTTYTSRWGVSASMQISHYAILSTRKETAYPYVGCKLISYTVGTKQTATAGDIVIMTFICPLRNILPAYVNARATILIEPPEFSLTHSHLRMYGILSSGDVGSTVTIEGGRTKWINLGTYLVSVTKTVDAEVYNLGLDYQRFIKPHFKLTEPLVNSNGVEMQFMMWCQSSVLICNPVYSSVLVEQPMITPDVLGSSNTCLGFLVQNDRIVIDAVVELPDPSTSMVAVCIRLDYTSPAYRQNTYEDLSITSIEIGAQVDSNGNLPSDGNIKQSRFVMYDVVNEKIPMLVLASDVRVINHADIVFYLIPRYYVNDDVPDYVTNEPGTFLLRLEGTGVFNSMPESLGIHTPISMRGISVTTHPVSKLPYDVVKWSDTTNPNSII